MAIFAIGALKACAVVLFRLNNPVPKPSAVLGGYAFGFFSVANAALVRPFAVRMAALGLYGGPIAEFMTVSLYDDYTVGN